MSKFFINRPIVAIVISIVMVIVGVITIISLPVAQFPNIAPPEVQIQATYVGADAQTLEQSVATPIEQQMSGVDHMNYMYSLNATANGQMTMIVDFDVKTDPNTDQILAQMRETQAASQLPADVNNFGVTVQKSVTSPLMLITLYSPKGTYDASFLSNFAYINIRDPLTRSAGIGNVQIFGAGQYAMRLWVKPDQLGKLGITVTDIINAIQTQNTVNPAGQVGGEPVPKGQEYTYSVLAQGRLISEEDFGQIVVRETSDGGVVRVKDVARVELGSQDYTRGGPVEREAGSDYRRLPAAGLKRGGRGERREETDRRDEGEIPAGHGLRDFAGHDEGGDVRDQGDCRDAADRDRAGDPGGVHLPAKLARDADSDAGGAGGVDRNIYFFPALRIFDQHAFAVGAGAGHWIGGGRRDRGGGGRGAAHRGRAVAERRGVQGDGGVDRAGGGNRAGAFRRIRADGLYSGNHGASVSAICGDDRNFRNSFGIQRAHSESGAGGSSAEAERREQRLAGKIFWLVQPRRSREGQNSMCACRVR